VRHAKKEKKPRTDLTTAGIERKEEKKREEGEEVSISLQILDGEEERKAVVAAKARSV
jgi:MoaA/NifB/PqqE/SkfB family radical SAM enzyme